METSMVCYNEGLQDQLYSDQEECDNIDRRETW